MTRTRRVQKLINERFRTVPYTTLCARTFRPDHDVRVYTLGFTYHRSFVRSFVRGGAGHQSSHRWMDRSIERSIVDAREE